MHYQGPWVGIAGGALSSPDSLIVLGRMGLSEEVKVIPLIVSKNLSVSVRGS